MTSSEWRIEPLGQKDFGPCDCCGNMSRTVNGYVYRDDATEAVYFVQWTLDSVDKHGAHFDLIVGKWGDGVCARDRVAISVEFRRTERGPGFMVIDAGSRPVSKSDLVGAALCREEVVGTVKAQIAFQLLDANWLQDPRIREITGGGK